MDAPQPADGQVLTDPLLTPEEDAIGEPDQEEDDIDDLLPADLWF
jgi:hypothetical protein